MLPVADEQKGSVTRGLTSAEVAERHAAGQSNDVPNPTSRSYAQIVRANVFTRFNGLLGVLLVAIIAVGEYKDALFGIVLVLNALIGIIQESRAKQTLDRLTLVSAPQLTVWRDGEKAEVPIADIVLDDIIELSPGDQIGVDGVVLEALGLEVDESLLTGESDAVVKHPDAEVLSGSFVAAGSGIVRATKVGKDAYAYKINEDASRFTLVKSELRDGVNQILRVVPWLMIPTAGLLITAQVRSQNNEAAHLSLRERVTDAVQGSVAGLVAMVPEGQVLLTSLAFAHGVIRLGRKNVLTQELAAIEGLARVDVICLDKTGTLTEGELQLDDVDHLGDAGQSSDALAALVHADPSPNPSLRAIGNHFDHDPGWTVTTLVPFSSARKWAATTFDAHGTYLLGAPDILLAKVSDAEMVRAAEARVHAYASKGRRVLLLAQSSAPVENETLPDHLRTDALVVLEEKVRPEAPDTIRYFLEQGVQVKVISGDSATTVGAVAERVGVPGADDPIDARTMSFDDVDVVAEILETHTVFGRVTPHQKRVMVHALQSRGHEVAMTGDGVNDTLALKDAEIGVAMGTGSPAARAVARFVLLDNSFAVFPSVVAEGRRVIANVERVANLFLTKTFYAMLLSIIVGVFGLAFPFVPRHLTIISTLTIGVPAFFLALAPNGRRARPGFLSRVLRMAIPSGITAALATFAAYLVATRSDGVQLGQARTMATIVLFLIAMWVLSILARPWNWWRAALILTMTIAFVSVLEVPRFSAYFALELPATSVVLAGFAIGCAACVVLEVGWRVFGWVDRDFGHHHHPAPSADGERLPA
jgi:cation-transporting ATPase E